MNQQTGKNLENFEGYDDRGVGGMYILMCSIQIWMCPEFFKMSHMRRVVLDSHTQ